MKGKWSLVLWILGLVTVVALIGNTIPAEIPFAGKLGITLITIAAATWIDHGIYRWRNARY